MNHAFQVRMVKKDKNENASSDPINQFEDKITLVQVCLQNLAITIGKVVFAYIAADTIRQIMVEKTSK